MLPSVGEMGGGDAVRWRGVEWLETKRSVPANAKKLRPLRIALLTHVLPPCDLHGGLPADEEILASSLVGKDQLRLAVVILSDCLSIPFFTLSVDASG